MDVMQLRRNLLMNISEDNQDYFAHATWVEREYYNANGAILQNDQLKRIDTFIPVMPNKSYLLTGHTTNAYAYDRVLGYGQDKMFLTQIARLDWLSGDFSSIVTIPEGCYFIRLSTEIVTEVHMYDNN